MNFISWLLPGQIRANSGVKFLSHIERWNNNLEVFDRESPSLRNCAQDSSSIGYDNILCGSHGDSSAAGDCV